MKTTAAVPPLAAFRAAVARDLQLRHVPFGAAELRALVQDARPKVEPDYGLEG